MATVQVPDSYHEANSNAAGREGLDWAAIGHEYAAKALAGGMPQVTSPQYALSGALTAMAQEIERLRALASVFEERPYKGAIEPGMGFLWEPTLPYAREALVVVGFQDGDVLTVSQTAIGMPELEANRSGSLAQPRDKSATLNSESRFREAVVRCTALDEPPLR